jgi:tetratricopeptide (TPR) repeat protein
MARLDQLGPAKELAQIAAVLGSEISLPLLGVVAGLDDPALHEGLDTLVAADILSAREMGGETIYSFRHALIETAAYETLLKRIRRTLHKRAAQALVERFAAAAEHRPEVVAQHWLRAGEQREAISAWRQAAERACEHSAFREAQRAAEQGIAVIRSLSPSPDLVSDELALQSLLADASQGADGYASPRVLAAMERVKELAGRQGDIAQQLHRTFGEWAALSSRGDYVGSAAPADRFVQLARSEASPAILGYAQMIVMTSRYRTGDLLGAEAAYQDGLDYFADRNFPRRPGAAAQTFGNAAVVAWLLGRHDEAARRNERSLEVSRATGNPYDLAFACDMAATQALLASRPSEAESFALEGIRLSEEHGYTAFASATRIALGRAQADLGRPAEGAALMAASLHGPGQAAVRSSMTMYLTWLAEVHDALGATELALATIENALSVNPQEVFFRAESLRVRGDLSRRRGALDSARADYRAAVALARSIRAEVFVQRTLASLAALDRSDRA